jgi:hypothetical protein
VRYITGSARIIEHDTPLPEQTGFSESDPIFPFNKEPALMLGLDELLIVLLASDPVVDTCAPVAFSREGLDIVVSPSTVAGLALRANIVEGSDEAIDRDARGDLGVSGLADLVELAAEDVAADELEDDGKKTEPSTLFAVSRDASFVSCIRSLEGFFGGGGGGEGRRSKGTKPAGSRVICIECGRRCRGRQGGVGSVGVCDLNAKKLGGV